jgi:acyl carrier protein
MGLDTVELVIEIEEAFGVSIPDERAQEMVTVGDVYQFLIDNCPAAEVRAPQPCSTAKAFYALRRGLCEVSGIDRSEVRTTTAVDALLPPQCRRETWGRLRATLSLTVPPLRRPAWLSRLLLILPFAAVAASAAYLAIDRPGQLLDAWPALLGWGFYLAVEGYLSTMRFAVCLPPGLVTTGDLARDLLACNPRFYQQEAWHHRDIWHTLVRIFANCLNVDPARITPEATIVGDLGAA